MKRIRNYQDWSIKAKLGVVFGWFALLAVINYLSITYCKNQQEKDAPVVDAAGRNRMLSQRIGFFAERIAQGQESVREDLQKAIVLHDTSLRALKVGGVAPGIANNQVLPPTPPHILPTLQKAEDLWTKYRQHAEVVAQAPLYVDTTQFVTRIDSAGMEVSTPQTTRVRNPRIPPSLAFIEENASPLLAKNNALVKAFVQNNQQKQSFIEVVLLGLLLLNFALTALAVYIVGRYVIRPAQMIRQTTQQLARGNLSVKTTYTARDELGTAAQHVAKLTQNLAGIADFARAIGKGNFGSDFQKASEDDSLTEALLRMRDQLRTAAQEEADRKWLADGLSHFDKILREDRESLTDLAQHLLSSLIKFLEINQGALYLLNEDGEEAYLERVATYAWGRKKYRGGTIAPGEGLTGQAWLEGKITYLQEIPSDYVRITSGLGRATPRCLLIVPLKANEVTVGVLEIAALRELTDNEQTFVATLSENVAAVFATARINQKTQRLLAETQEQTESMRAAEEEMRQNLEELAATQEEMGRKESEYQRIIAELKEGAKPEQKTE
ncbi:MAG: GAF domain-containing protein [Tunicatimonas sp.]